MADEDSHNNEQLPAADGPSKTHTIFRTKRDPTVLSNHEYRESMRALNKEQKSVVTHHIMW